MPPRIHIKFYYDIISPYSYFAFETLRRYRDAWNINLTLKPVWLGSVMVASKNVPPGAHPLRAAYLKRDVKRLTQLFQMDVRPPPGHPMQTSTINVMRFLRVVEEQTPEALEEASARLYAEFFAVHTPVASPEFFHCLTPSPFSSDKLQSLLQASQMPENKERAKADAQSIVDNLGTFGMPWIEIQRADGEKESFFGSDRMECIADWLGKSYRYSGPFPTQAEQNSRL
ncbi:hypothetical protein BOTBODRAFT_33773 [Botryobasidium botryosum FD-172 SS1]|uniref:Glutathione S-transferase kappa n=1 Tax=Botryobasidium botryosum (strain FD-172 SS1) TaxID=930990 RepID=A0A067MNJ7_BOTB1|nr:hypothetical protein BOTBODRAFT_33773 [Botryobasidium botryosum FD-172 SS1]